MPDLPKDLIKDFLDAGTANGFGDLSMMVSHITKAYSTGLRAGREEMLKMPTDEYLKLKGFKTVLSPNQNTKE